jgi:hypothetical protein
VSQLTPEELQRMTGRERGAAQLRYFRNLGLHVFPDGEGHPVVTWEAINALLLGQQKQAVDEPELDLRGAFRKAGGGRG